MKQPPGLLISAPSSGTGKTTVMLGLLRALRDKGLLVQPFKSGPDNSYYFWFLHTVQPNKTYSQMKDNNRKCRPNGRHFHTRVCL